MNNSGAPPDFRANNLDDLLRHVLVELRNAPLIEPSRGTCHELTGVRLVLTDPTQRLSRTLGRGKVFSALGELTWYLAGSEDADHIEYYLPAYSEYRVDGRTQGAYGPRLGNPASSGQLNRIVNLLKNRPSSRRAVALVLREDDVHESTDNYPCTVAMQLLLRSGVLEAIVFMRSNDAWLGLPHDIFAFTMIHELIARLVGVSLGPYTHFVGSLHLYSQHVEGADSFLKEGWQSTRKLMQSMPGERLAENLAKLLQNEKRIRMGLEPTLNEEFNYWRDLEILLQAYAARRSRNGDSFNTYIHQLSQPDLRVILTSLTQSEE